MKTFNAAGRFWLSYVVLLFAGLIYSTHGHAGYYVTVVSHTGSMQVGNFNIDGKTSLCYLTPSMAIAGLAGTTTYYNVTSLTADGTWSVLGNGGSSAGIYSSCVAVPSVYSLPVFVGGVSDPAISGDSILSASGGGSGSADMEAYFGFNAELFEIAVGGSLVVFAIGLGVGLLINVIRRARHP